MHDTTRRQGVLTAIARLAECYRQRLSEAQIESYEIALGDLTVEQIDSGVVRSVLESKWMPSPVELRAYAKANCGESIDWIVKANCLRKYVWDQYRERPIEEREAIFARAVLRRGIPVDRLPQDQFPVVHELALRC